MGLWLEELAFLRGLEMLKLLPWGYMEGFIIRNACLVLVQAWAQSTPKPWNFLSNRSVGASLVTVFGLLSSVPGDAPQPRMESMSPCSQGASFHPPLSGFDAVTLETPKARAGFWEHQLRVTAWEFSVPPPP